MSGITHPQLVAALTKPGSDILRSLTPEKCDLWHVASCIPGEAGELFDAVKKHVIYEKGIDRANVIEELGDLEFYMERTRTLLNITREETLAANIAKLRERYEKKTGVLGYSNAAAQERLDKAKDRREGFQMTRESAENKSAWPAWLKEVCWAQKVEWGQWIVREPDGTLAIEDNFKPGE